MKAAGWEGSSRAVQASREGVTDLEAGRIGDGQEEQEGRRGRPGGRTYQLYWDQEGGMSGPPLTRRPQRTWKNPDPKLY